MGKMASYRIAAAWIALLIFAGVAMWLGQIGRDVRLFQFAYLIGFLGYLTLVIEAWRNRSQTNPTRWRWWIVGCIVVRALLLSTTPSDDTYRYVWEGRIQHAGFNPYVHAPDDPVLESLRNEDWTKINHPNYPAIYGPVAQLQFYVAALVYPSGYAIKAVHVVWDVLTLIVLGAGLRRMGCNPKLAIVYGASPLILTAIGIEGHLDSLMLLLLALTVWGVHTNRTFVTGLFLGLAMGVKVIPIVLLPWFLFRMRRSGLTAIIVCAACYIPYLGAGMDLFTSLRRFGAGDMFFSPLALLNAAFELKSPDVLEVERMIAVACIGLALLLLARRRDPFATYAVNAMGSLLLLAPVLHLWYLSWVLVFLPFVVRAPWLITSCVAVLYYEATRHQELTGFWVMPHWPAIVVWSSFLLAWIADRAVLNKISFLRSRTDSNRVESTTPS